MKWQKFAKWTFVGVGGLVTLAVLVASIVFGVFIYQMRNAGDLTRPGFRSSAIKATMEWTRLAPFPVPESELDVRTLGSPFTRQFVVRFHSSPNAIRDWVKRCTILDGVKPRQVDEYPELKILKTGDSYSLYTFQGGGGACCIDLLLSKDGRSVIVSASWS